MPFYLKLLKKLQVQQYLREDGPQSHAKKANTPTAGGVVFIASTLIGLAVMSLFFCARWLTPDPVGPLMQVASANGLPSGGWPAAAWLVFLTAVACGLLGFADDFAKVLQKSNKGVSPKVRLVVEAIIGALLAIGLLSAGPVNVWLPEWSGSALLLVPHAMPYVVAFLLSVFLVMATTNAVNLHDGMDGLAAGTCILVLCTISSILARTDQLPLSFLALITTSSLIAFLFYNRNPAKIFMGDTGSLFLGGLLAGLTLAGGILIWFVPLALIYITEVISVIIQKAVFKLTKPYTPEKPMSELALIKLKLTRILPGEGRRVFRMTPLHHHYEIVAGEHGIKENQVVAYFWLAQAVVCVVVWLACQFMPLASPH